MKRLLVVFGLAFAMQSYGQNDAEFVKNQLIVKFRNEVIHSSLRKSSEGTSVFGIPKVDELNSSHGYTGSEKVFKPNAEENLPASMQDVYLLNFFQPQDILSLVKEYMATGLFEYVEPNYIVRGHGEEGIQVTPNDPVFNSQWGLYNNGTYSLSGLPAAKVGADINAKCAWDITTGDTSTVVAIIDTGSKLDHPEFTGRLWKNKKEIAGNGIDDDNNGYKDDIQGWDFINNDNNASDDHGHGSNTSGIVGMTGNNSTGMAGVNWKCRLMIVKCLDANNAGTNAGLTSAINYAANNGAKVLSISIGGNATDPALQAAIDNAYNKGSLVVVSMGNNNNSTKQYPAACPHVMAVGATNPDDTRANPFTWGGGSNYGTWISVVAPGNGIQGMSRTSNTSFTSYWSGTSQSCPAVAGVASLIYALNPNFHPDSVKSFIEKTAIDKVGKSTEDVAGYDQYMGWGRVDACKALQRAKNTLTGIIPIEPISGGKSILFPNPFSVSSIIRIDKSQAREGDRKIIRVYDGLGKEVKNLNTTSNEVLLSRDELPDGIYFYRIIANDTVIVSEKFILAGQR